MINRGEARVIPGGGSLVALCRISAVMFDIWTRGSVVRVYSVVCIDVYASVLVTSICSSDIEM